MKINNDDKVIIFANKPATWSKIIDNNRFTYLFWSAFQGNNSKNPNATINFFNECGSKIFTVKIKDVIHNRETNELTLLFDKIENQAIIGKEKNNNVYKITNGSLFIDNLPPFFNQPPQECSFISRSFHDGYCADTGWGNR